MLLDKLQNTPYISRYIEIHNVQTCEKHRTGRQKIQRTRKMAASSLNNLKKKMTKRTEDKDGIQQEEKKKTGIRTKHAKVRKASCGCSSKSCERIIGTALK